MLHEISAAARLQRITASTAPPASTEAIGSAKASAVLEAIEAAHVKRCRKCRTAKAREAPKLWGDVDVYRIAPYRATWTCGCGLVSTVHTNHVMTVGNVLNRRVACEWCSAEYRARYILDLAGRR